MKLNKKTVIFFGSALIIAAAGLIYFFVFKKSQPNCLPAKELPAEQSEQLIRRCQENYELLKEFPDYYDVFLDLGNIYRTMGNYDLAVKYFDKAWQAIPSNSTPYLNIAAVYEDQKNYDQAFEAYWKAQEINPAYDFIYERIVDFYSKFYPQKEAEIPQVYQLGIQKVSDYWGLKRGLAKYYFEKKRYEEAITLLEEVAAKDPEDEFVKTMLEEAKNNLKQ